MRPHPANLWRHADFLRLWAAQAVSALGSQITLVALPLVAVLTLDASPVEVGVLAAIGNLPALLFGLSVGVWVDRLRRRPLMIGADVGRAILLLGVPLGAVSGWLNVGYLAFVAFCVGTLDLVFNVAAGAHLPDLIGRERLVEAESKFSLSASSADIAGPGLAGVLASVVTAPLAVVADSLSFLFSALCIGAIRKPETAPGDAHQSRRFWAETGEGLRLVLAHPLLRPLVASAALVAFWSSALEAVLLLYLVRELGVSPAAVGIVFAVSNVGLLVGAVATSGLVRRSGVGLALIVALIVIGAADLAPPLLGATPLPITAPVAAVATLIAAQFAFGVAVVVYRVTSAGLRAGSTADAYQGRMNGTVRFLSQGLTPVGALIGGILGERIGLQATLVLAALGEIASAIVLAASPVRTLRQMPTP